MKNLDDVMKSIIVNIQQPKYIEIKLHEIDVPKRVSDDIPKLVYEARRQSHEPYEGYAFNTLFSEVESGALSNKDIQLLDWKFFYDLQDEKYYIINVAGI